MARALDRPCSDKRKDKTQGGRPSRVGEFYVDRPAIGPHKQGIGWRSGRCKAGGHGVALDHARAREAGKGVADCHVVVEFVGEAGTGWDAITVV